MNILSMCVASISMLVMASFEAFSKIVDIVLNIITVTGIGALSSWFIYSGTLQKIIAALVS